MRVIGNKLKAMGYAGAVLTGMFLSASSFAQNSPLDILDVPQNNTFKGGDVKSVQTLLPDFSESALAGALVDVEVCVKDGMDDHETCRSVRTLLPMPNLKNPIGIEVQKIRKDLAVVLEEALHKGNGTARPEDIREGVKRVVDSYSDFLDENSIKFAYLETLVRTMDLHYDLIVNGVKNPDIHSLENFLSDLRDVILQLEADLLSPAEKAFKEAQEELDEALKKGDKTKDEIAELQEKLNKAFEKLMKERMEQEQQKQGDQLSADEQKQNEQLEELMKALKEALEKLGLTPEQYAELMNQMAQGSKPGNSPPQGPQSQKNKKMSYEEMLKMWKEKIEKMQKLSKYIKDINEIIEGQEKLRDETLDENFKSLDQNKPVDKDLIDKLEAEQEALEKRLKDIAGNMKADQLDTEAFEEALGEMGEAEDDLELDRPAEAVPDMDEALEALRQGQDQNQQSMMNMMGGSGNMSGQGEGDGGSGLQKNTDNWIDGDGKLLPFGNSLNESLGIEQGDDNGSRDMRDRIIENQRKSGNSDYLRRLLEP